MSTDQEILVTGIKVVDLLAPYAKGGKIGEIADLCDGVIINGTRISLTGSLNMRN